MSMAQINGDVIRIKLAIALLKLLVDRSGGKNQEIKKCYEDFVRDQSKGNKLCSDKLSQNLACIPEYKRAFRFLLNQFHAWKSAYTDLIKANPKLHVEQFNVDDFLLSFQHKVKFDIEEFERENSVNNKYLKPQSTYNTQINIGRSKYAWTKQFVEEWREKKKKNFQELKPKLEKQQQRMKQPSKPTQIKQEIKRQQPKIQEKVKEEPKGKGILKIVKKQEQLQVEKPNLNEEKSLQKKIQKIQLQQKINNQIQSLNRVENIKTTKVSQTIRQTFKNQFIKNNQKKKITQNDSDSDESDDKSQIKSQISKVKRQEEFNQNSIKGPKLVFQKRNRIPIIRAYLQSRKDLNISAQNLTTVAEFLNQKLFKFMKNILEQTIYAAKLRNYNYSKKNAGDEFRYFSKDNNSLKFEIPFNFPLKSKILQLKYPSKLETYANMRMEEEEKQEKLRQELNQKRDDDKKKENKILDYLLRQREIRTEGWTQRQETQTNRLVISVNHVQIVLEDHEWFNDGIAMFKSYHF